MAAQSGDSKEQLQRLHILDQNVQQMVLQKQQFQAQLFEIDNALKEIASAPQAFKIIGNIMVAAEKSTLSGELKNKKELVELRVKSIEKQEVQLREKVRQLQEDVLKNVKK